MPGKDATLAELLEELGWSGRELSRRLGLNDATVRNWTSGRRQPPESVMEWLRARVRAAGRAPDLPEGWKRDGDC